VHAVGGVDLQFGLAFFLHHLVDSRGTKILAGIAIFSHAFSGADIKVGNHQMAGLIFLMPRAGVVDVRQPVERQRAVTLETRRRADVRPVDGRLPLRHAA